MDKVATARFVWRFLSPLPFMWRLHQVVRSLLSPFAAVIAAIAMQPVEDDRKLLDLGCGHGVFLALAKQAFPGLGLIGIDLSESKIASARVAFEAAGLEARELAVRDIADFAQQSVDVISILDVLYLAPIEQWDGILGNCYACLRPGGLLLLKEMNRAIDWKFRLLCLEETLAVKVLGLTLGEKFTFPFPDEIRARLERAGFDVEQKALDRGYYVPHMLWIARKPA